LLGVHPQSWALWLGEAIELPVRILATDGARSADLVRDQLPRVGDGYDVACLYIGANDARATDFDGSAFAQDVRTAVDRLRRAADRLVVLTIPEDLGRPRAGADVLAVNETIRALARGAGAVLVELRDFGGRRVVLPDAVHPTAPGMVAIADRAAAALGETGVRVVTRPHDLCQARTSRRDRARYGAWWGRQWLRDRARQTRERRRARPSGRTERP